MLEVSNRPPFLTETRRYEEKENTSKLRDKLIAKLQETQELYASLNSQNPPTTTAFEGLRLIGRALLNPKKLEREINTIKLILDSSNSTSLADLDREKIREIIKSCKYNHSVEIEGKVRSLLTLLSADSEHFQYPELLQGLINSGYDLNQKEPEDQKAYTVLHWTIANGNYQNAIKLLKHGDPYNVKQGINVNLKDQFGNNALLFFLKRKNIQDSTTWMNLFNHLIYYTRDLNDTDIFGNTALHLAAISRNEHLVEILLKSNADKTIRNKRGQLAVDLWKLDIPDLQALTNALGHFPEVGDEEQCMMFDVSARNSEHAVPPPPILHPPQEITDPRQKYIDKVNKLEKYQEGYHKALDGQWDSFDDKQFEKISKVVRLALQAYLQKAERKLILFQHELSSGNQPPTTSHCIKETNLKDYISAYKKMLTDYTIIEHPANEQAVKIDNIVRKAIEESERRTAYKLNTLGIILTSSYPGFLLEDDKDVEKVKKIIKECAFNISVRTLYGSTKQETPLLKILCAFVERFRDNGIIEALHNRGFDLNKQDGESGFNPYPGNTILLWTVANAHYSNAIELVKKGIPFGLDVNLQDEIERNNALLLVLKKGVRQDPLGWKGLLEVLIPNTDLDKADSQGNTPLHIACFRRDEELVKLLIQYGSSPSILNNRKQLPAALWRVDVVNLKDKNLSSVIGYDANENQEDETITFDIEERAKRSNEPPAELLKK